MITNYDIGKYFYGDIGVDKMVLILTEHHPCCEFCAKRFDQKNCKMECEEGVEGWLLQEAEKDEM